MSNIEEFFTQTGVITRQTWSNDSSVELTGVTIPLHLQPGIGNKRKYTENIAQSFTKPHTMWCAEGSDIQDGDTITINGSNYSVKYDSDWNVGDEDDHMEILLEKL